MKLHVIDGGAIEYSDDLVESLHSYLDDVAARGTPISSIAIAINFSNKDSALSFAGEDLVGLLGLMQLLTRKISQKLEDTNG